MVSVPYQFHLPKFMRIVPHLNTDMSPIKATVLGNGIERSAQDTRKYKSIFLDNGLQVLLISDSCADKAAAAMDVSVGHFMDPDEYPGLAHFLEHMLFLGTEKYPDENSYSEFLNKHGGNSNAFTACEHTNYHFEVLPDYLEDALDRFAQFFIAPLFTSSSTDRELMAVDSENKKNLQNDSWRLYQLSKSLAKSTHPFHKFGTGNETTLRKPGTRDALLQFHRDHYYAGRMKLAVLGTATLDQMQEWVKGRFQNIRSSRGVSPEFPPNPFSNTVLGRRVSVEPVKNLRLLQVSFQLPSQLSLYQVQPERYFAHLIGHESSGSILCHLKKLGLAHELSAGLNMDESSFSTFDVSVELTRKGLAQTEEVCRTIYEYLEILRQMNDADWGRIHGELRVVQEQKVQFLPKSRPISYVTTLAGNLHLYPTKHAVLGKLLIRKYNLDLIRKTLEHFKQDSCYVMVVSKDWTRKQASLATEPWYGTRYSVSDLPNDFFTGGSVVRELHIPPWNQFIAPSSLYEAPDVIIEDESLKVFYEKDITFGDPKTNVTMNLICPIVTKSENCAVMVDMLLRVTEDKLTELTYNAQIAGQAFSLARTPLGIELRFSGYSEKQPELIAIVLRTLTSHTLDEKRFSRVKEQYQRSLENYRLESPLRHATDDVTHILVSPHFESEELLLSLRDKTVSNVLDFRNLLFQEMYCEMLVHGNTTVSIAFQYSQLVRNYFQLRNQTIHHPTVRVLALAKNSVHRQVRKETNVNQFDSAVHMVYQFGAKQHSRQHRIMSLLIGHLVNEAFYDQLRTKEQLGYLVYASPGSVYGLPIIRFSAQSNKATAAYLEERILKFVNEYFQILRNMPNAEFQENLNSVIANCLHEPKTLNEKTRRYWYQIKNQTYDFVSRKIDAEELGHVTLDMVLQKYKEYMKNNPALLRCLRTGTKNPNARPMQTLQ